jgi:pSer/pThr/pTyr-binding forkhead associated (FHA) protein
MYKLLQIVDDNVVGEYPLDRDNFRIGRKPGNDLQPDDASVSGSHASITLAPSAYMDDMQEATIEDLDSTNGTCVNGKRIKKQLLKHGDILTMGMLTMKFIDEQALAVEGTRILLQEEET